MADSRKGTHVVAGASTFVIPSFANGTVFIFVLIFFKS